MASGNGTHREAIGRAEPIPARVQPGMSKPALAKLVVASCLLLLLPFSGLAEGEEESPIQEYSRQPFNLLPSFGIVPTDSLGDSPTLQEYLGYAVAHNEELTSSILAWKAVGDRAPQASALPDPRFTFTEYLQAVETRVGPMKRGFGISQKIPWFGTLSLKGKIEDERAATAAARINSVLLAVIYRIKKAFFDLAFLGRSILITEEHLNLLVQWEEVARAKLETGGGSYADLVKTQVELGKLDDRLDELRDRYRPLAATLNAKLSRPVGTEVPVPTLPVVHGEQLPEDLLADRLAAENPDLKALEHQAQGHLREENLAEKQWFPDLTLGLSYIQVGQPAIEGIPDSGKDPLLASISINLPLWWGSYRAAKKEAAGFYLSTHSAHEDRQNTLTASLENALFGYRDALRKVDLYGDTLLPKARQSLGATSAAYETGKLGFLDLIDAERVLLEFQLSHARSSADLMIKLAEIEMLVGGPVAPGPEAVGQEPSIHRED